MKKILAVGAIVFISISPGLAQSTPTPPKQNKAATKLLPRLPDFGFLPQPGEYNSRIFRVSQDFPIKKPAMEPAIQKILSFDQFIPNPTT
ncbi:MAG: hypothetical protein QOK24_2756 [Verrucomicrobiota bacterium]|jgi:hypothetical protein